MELIIAQNGDDIARLKAMRSSITERGVRPFSRWGIGPFVETTRSDLHRIDHDIAELEQLTADILSGRFN